ncbi:phosphatase PAP2 family protein [Pseudomonas lundensis]|uniref:phosphatase PAP2 family protein n=1 Tax=Serratia proteamaculans TaxID=28151 RepID=UPI0029823087|nr:phosphatase PAP2 family protein [Serratia proteamaculans]MDW5500124.1 phosphatase PAP2 family protein [Serratia proteamaculans]MDW5505190.1 phosphatase PAP2 family protein [Pseudomonas lundensis]
MPLAAPNSSNPATRDNQEQELWRIDYADIGYPDVGFSTHIRGWIKSYLEPQDYADGCIILAPPPAIDSAAWQHDLASLSEYRKLHPTPRGQQALDDAQLDFAHIGRAFSSVIGVEISREHTPHLHLLLHRLLTDAACAACSAKQYFQRSRPKKPTSASAASLHLTDGSYPSGHAVTGLLWAMALTAMLPQQATAIMQRGIEFGRSRLICVMHWESDILAGQLIAAAAFARLQACREYQRHWGEAQNELANILSQSKAPSLTTRSVSPPSSTPCGIKTR